MGQLKLSEQAAASTPASGEVVLYPKTDKRLYMKDDAGNEILVSHQHAKNVIINGDFNVWQRGTSFVAAASGQVGPDRYTLAYITAGVVTMARSTDVPTATERGYHKPYSLLIDCTTVDSSIAAGDVLLIYYKPEGHDAARFGFGQLGTRNITLSFWVKATKTGIYCVSFANSAKTRSYVAEYTVNTTATWEFKTITLAVDTSGTWLYDSGIGIHIAFTLMAGTDVQVAANTWSTGNYLATANQVNGLDSTANDFRICGVQLEAGTVATDFEQRTIQEELALCQRYFSKSYSIDVAPATATAVGMMFVGFFVAPGGGSGKSFSFPVEMRTAPTMVGYTSAGASGSWTDATGAARAVNFYNTSSRTSSGVIATGDERQVQGHWTASAEL